MSGRTCQFCGKPLSRFSVGSGGDFCSREHRNQYRLRAGMDRLEEANKVANLMRRRENAKVIPATQLARESQAGPRVAPALRLPPHPPSIRSLAPLPASLGDGRIAAATGGLMSPAPAQTASTAPPRIADRPAGLVIGTVRPLIPQRANRTLTRLAAAGTLALQAGGTPPAEARRRVTILNGRRARTHIGPDGIQIGPAAAGIRRCQEPRPAVRLMGSADRGEDLRVSGSVGFRIPAIRVRNLRLAAARTEALPGSTRPRFSSTVSRPAAADRIPAAIRIELRELIGPKCPAKNGAVEFHWPSALLPDNSRPLGAAESARSCASGWRIGPPRIDGLRSELGRVIPFRALNGRNPSALQREPRAIHSAPKLTLVDFAPPEKPFEWSPTALDGTLGGGMQFGANPVRRKEPQPITAFEEHFDGGLKNWVGGIDDWKVDVAGVRACSLALFEPSIEMVDYQVEFLARIETRGVSWVFRAANFNDYYMATLVVSPAGGYEFRRSAVLGGQPETPIGRPVAARSNASAARTAVTLRTRVVRNEFTVYLDGQVIDTWTDNRLVTGGIGFVGAPDDRARLYWVKLTPAGHPSKEHSKL